ncbi:XdhC family protein [Undibacterium rugosum]|uniref:XdhC family protein n=1 Tax=Undibacterium rugosum TaxID=2762291 RepID=A0A923KYW9_9BURK|nr:XdhC family protein [Undibacterium rugosum]MBC3935028.1 XdhC family protein [Undibacterium rugosum]MBR7778111.1 XdhC family protein [Undibacterium rugosum]
MDSMDLEVLKTCARWQQQGKACLLVTVVTTWGSSPRPVGSMLVLNAHGQVAGSVSGGCIEDDLIARVQQQGIVQSVPERVTYGVSAEEAHRFGLPCGGTIQLVLEPVGPRSQIAELLTALAAGQLTRRSLNLRTGAVHLSAAQPSGQLTLSNDVLDTIHGPRWRLLIIGAGPLSRFLASIATGLDYQVTVCDPREEYRSEWTLPSVPVVHAMPDDLVLEMQLDTRSAVVALSHDPKLDDLALMEALKSPAFYVGAIGSRINNQRRRERLKEFDLNEQQLARLHGPIGLYIGSKTPPEIAISILAQMTAIKNGVDLPEQTSVALAKESAQIGMSGAECALKSA